jgi:DNA repair exonuclease SbcCD ATPase subunit
MTLMASDQAFVLRDIAKENDIKLTPSEGAEIRQILAGQAKKLKESEAKQEATAEALKEQKKEFTEEKKEMRKVAAERLKEAIAKEKAKTSEVKEKAQEKVEAAESKKAVSDFDKKMAQLEAKEVKAELKEANAEIKNLGKAIKSLLDNWKKDVKEIRAFRRGIIKAVNDSLKGLKKGGEVKSSVVKTIIRQALNIDDDVKLTKFIDNVSEIINNAALQESIDKIVSNQKGARGKRKNNRFTQAVREFTTLPIYDKNGDLTLSEADLEVYAEAVKELNKAIPNHKVMYQMMPNGKTLFDTVMDAKQKVYETEFDAKYIDIENLEEIFDIILAANYLVIKPLLDLSCAKIASLIKGMYRFVTHV